MAASCNDLFFVSRRSEGGAKSKLCQPGVSQACQNSVKAGLWKAAGCRVLH